MIVTNQIKKREPADSADSSSFLTSMIENEILNWMLTVTLDLPSVSVVCGPVR